MKEESQEILKKFESAVETITQRLNRIDRKIDHLTAATVVPASRTFPFTILFLSDKGNGKGDVSDAMHHVSNGDLMMIVPLDGVDYTMKFHDAGKTPINAPFEGYDTPQVDVSSMTFVRIKGRGLYNYYYSLTDDSGLAAEKGSVPRDGDPEIIIDGDMPDMVKKTRKER